MLTKHSRINVFVERGDSIEAVRTRILERLGDRYRLKVLALPELVAYHAGLIDKAFAVMNSVQLLSVIVTGRARAAVRASGEDLRGC